MSEGRRPVLSFVVPVRNGGRDLARCLSSIRATTTGLDTETIVADNGSTDDSAAIAVAAGARVLELPGRRVAEVRNAGARAAAGHLVAFVDADHELDPGWATAAVEVMSEARVSAAGAQYLGPSGGTWVQRTYDLFRRRRPGTTPVTWLPSGNLVVRREAFEAIGGFDATFETCEDVDLCQRLTARGGLIVSCDRLRSVHRGDPRTLKALFLSELWRGRDNLRASFRPPIQISSLPSAVIPMVTLLAFGLVAFGLATWVTGGWRAAAAGAVAFVLLAAVRAASLIRAASAVDRSPLLACRALVVSGVYDAARALALIVRVRHDTRRAA